jgi:hypothetical protein
VHADRSTSRYRRGLVHRDLRTSGTCRHSRSAPSRWPGHLRPGVRTTGQAHTCFPSPSAASASPVRTCDRNWPRAAAGPPEACRCRCLTYAAASADGARPGVICLKTAPPPSNKLDTSNEKSHRSTESTRCVQTTHGPQKAAPRPPPASARPTRESAPPAVIARGAVRSPATPARRTGTGHRPHLRTTGDAQPASGSTFSAKHGAAPSRPPARSRLANAVPCPLA